MQLLAKNREDTDWALLLVEWTRSLDTVDGQKTTLSIPDRLRLTVGDLVSGRLAELILDVDFAHSVSLEQHVYLSFLTLHILVDDRLAALVILRLDDHKERPDIFCRYLALLLANNKNVSRWWPTEVSNLLRRVIADKFDLKPSLLVLSHLINVDTVPFRIERVVSFVGFNFALRESMYCELMVFWLPNESCKLVDLSLDEDLLMGYHIRNAIQVKQLNWVLFCLLGPVLVDNTEVEALRVHH